MTNIQIIEKVKISLMMLKSKDAYLLVNNANERSITHKLAEYLQIQFENYNVDCEYNKNINDPKKIAILMEKLEMASLLKKSVLVVDDIDIIERSVYPDIIIHKRGLANDNLCIIEVKKTSSTISSKYDEIKLKAYTSDELGNELKYQLGIFICLDTNKNIGNAITKYFQKGYERN